MATTTFRLSKEYTALVVPDKLLPVIQSRVGDITKAVDSEQGSTTTAQARGEGGGQPQICLQLSSSQLVKLEGTSNDGIQSSCLTGACASLPGSTAVGSQKGPGVKAVCVNCRKAKKKCDSDLGSRAGNRPPGQLTAVNPTTMRQVPGNDLTHMAPPPDTEAMYGSSASRSYYPPAGQSSHDASWYSGPSTFHPGIMSLPMQMNSHSAQNSTGLAQPSVPPMAVPQPGYPGTTGPIMNMPAFPSYFPEYTAAAQADGSVPGSAHPVPESFGMYPSSQSFATSPPFQGDWCSS
ncbi:hypothetical protein GSI_14398 [Ganoderma sinense ZZ0214-1]|uniref:Transcription factor n=1 Tax=Ganoderma sinense ZZ0214-1 TaxID=1077348 RepID=A0A2G8RNL6_9APHY|nr:hypothetical protein GSI_14398 [Ganoderma sinense ZZ0214-1]